MHVWHLLNIFQKRDTDLQGLFKYELAPVPSSLLDDYDNLHIGTKSILLFKIAVITSTQIIKRGIIQFTMAKNWMNKRVC